MRWANGLELVGFAWLLGSVLKGILGEPASFEIVRSNLIFYNGLRQPSTTESGFQSQLTPQNPQQDRDHDHHLQHKHYRKGSARRNHLRKDSDTDRNARRQGQNCPGVCRYIPDRDFCPTDIVEEIEAYDDEEYDEEEEEEYSEENSIEDSEEYYDDDDDEDEDYYEDDEDNEVRRTEPRGTSSRSSDSAKPVYGPPLASTKNSKEDSGSLHVVFPSLTRFAVSRAASKNKSSNGNGTTTVSGRRRKSAAKRRQSQRRRRYRQRGRLVKLRQPALEQEILIRWDRVVERGEFIGGDILLPPGVLLRPPNFRFLRKSWPDGKIPFKMDASLNKCRQNAIFDAMDEIENKTCIKFVERDDERNYIDIRRALFGCSSYVGMVGGAQHLNLSTGCFSKFTVTHELMHAIGFDHEQSRKDRDKYIEVDFDNVLNQKEGQFELDPTFTGSGFPYDIRSIMHYSAFLFAKDKCEPTIYPVNEKIDICDLGAGNGKGGMTDCDAAKINKLYKCGKRYPQKCKVK